MWASPIKPPKAKKVEEETIKPAKPLISKAGAKSILGVRKGIDALGAFWVERWIDQFVRENSYPPQLLSDDFVAYLGKFFAPERASEILERIRKEYDATHKWDAKDDYEFLVRAIEADPNAIKSLLLLNGD